MEFIFGLVILSALISFVSILGLLLKRMNGAEVLFVLIILLILWFLTGLAKLILVI